MADPEALSELFDLTRMLRAHVEWQGETGATGLPRGATPGLEAPAVGQPTHSAAAANVTVEAAAVAVEREQPPRREASKPEAAPEPEPRAAAELGLSQGERQTRLSVLAAEVRACTRCALHQQRTQAVFSRGSGSSGLCFVGEGPGADEDAQGFPFVGAAGQLLDKMIAAMGLGRDEVYVCNIVKCRPPNNRKPEPEEMAACTPYLAEQIELLEPSVIVALGATAVQGLLGTSEGIMRLRGKWKLYKGRIAVMPTFHPAYLLRTPAAKREVWDDLQAVLRHMGRPLPARR
jgi:uracil-DNA glycosylase